MYDVAIVGSGVIGMSIAKALHRSGMKIAVIDRDVPGEHASYKAGGMLGAQNEFKGDSKLYRLAVASRDKFKALSREFMEENGIDIEYRRSGLIKMASHAEDVPGLDAQYDFLHRRDSQVRLLSKADLEALTLGAVEYRNRVIHIPDDGQINAWKYTKALLASLTASGIDRFCHTEVHRVNKKFDVYTLSTSSGEIHADKVIIAGGAWSGKLLDAQKANMAITGVKGEVLLVEHDGLTLEQTVFTTSGCYIVPKNKNRFLIGATSYFDDLTVGVSDAGVEWLKRQAMDHIPCLAACRMLKKWSGVRPYAAYEKPIMDELEPGLFVITGHYRNGILLSPLIGELVAEWVVKDQRPEVFREFQITKGGVNSEVYNQWGSTRV